MRTRQIWFWNLLTFKGQIIHGQPLGLDHDGNSSVILVPEFWSWSGSFYDPLWYCCWYQKSLIRNLGEKIADSRIFQKFVSKLENSARIASRSFGAADFNYWCCDNINLNVGAICYPDWNSWRIMLPSALKIFVNTPQVIEKRQNLPFPEKQMEAKFQFGEPGSFA